jgi:5'-deoxynucleotidase YfbR-like HD superfamily hydrolase
MLNERLKPTFSTWENSPINKIECPAEVIESIDKIDPKILAESKEDQAKAKETISSWVKILWEAMVDISDEVNANNIEKNTFYKKFKAKLIEFITHPDHGITHAYHVYKGMLYLDEKENKKLVPDSKLDKRAQLMALVHDSMQVLPFDIKGDNCELKYNHPKNEHAAIIAVITKKFGHVIGFSPETIAETIFGLKYHDRSYNNEKFNTEFDYISKLLHDSDKIFGASGSVDVSNLVSGMLERNYQANKGASGSYLLRNLSLEIRNLIIYGDRCYSDSVSLVRKEFKLEMSTITGKKLASERRKFAIQQVTKVYGKHFDLTKKFINDNLKQELVKLGTDSANLVLSIVGMDQEKKLIQKGDINNLDQLEKLINELYETPIKIIKPIINPDRYDKDAARGLKIRVFNNETKSEFFIDPSIARFCFRENGRTEFLELITRVFSSLEA